MGKSGDAPVTFPCITSLAVLGDLEEDEQYAIRTAQRIVQQAQEQSRTVFAVQPATKGTPASPQRVATFDPKVESLLIVSRIAGG